MNQTIKLDTRKRVSGYGDVRIAPLRRGERNNALLTVRICANGQPYDLTGKTASLVATTADGELVGPCPMEVAEAGTARIMLPAALYSAVGVFSGYVEIRDGEALVDTTDRFGGKVLECADLDAEQAVEFTPLLGELQNAVAEVKATEAKLYPAAEKVLKGTAKDTLVHIDDAFSGASLRGITVEGACRQDGTPSPDNPVPIQVIKKPVVKVTGRNLWPFASSCTSILGHQNEFVKDKTPFAILPGAYTFSAAGSLGNTDAPLFGYTATGKRIQFFRIMRNVTNPKYSFTVTEPIASIYFISNAADSNTGTISSIQLERNSTATEYKPHTSQTLTFALPAEHPYLAKLPDGTADEITVDRDGNVELVARVERVLPSDCPLDFGDGGNDSAYASLRYKHASIRKSSLMCSSYTPSNPTIKSGFIYTPNYTNIVIRDDRFTSKEQVAELLDGVVVYTAVEPTRYKLAPINMPKAQDSIVNAWTDAEATPNTGIKYVRDVNIVVANIESAIASTTEG